MQVVAECNLASCGLKWAEVRGAYGVGSYLGYVTHTPKHRESRPWWSHCLAAAAGLLRQNQEWWTVMVNLWRTNPEALDLTRPLGS